MEEALVSSAGKPRLSPQEVEAMQKRETLNLAKKKLQSDLESARSERHQAMLKAAIIAVENQINES
jgi:hypothetical protein